MSPYARGVLDGQAQGLAHAAEKAVTKAETISDDFSRSGLSVKSRVKKLGAVTALLELANELANEINAEARGESEWKEDGAHV